MAFFNKTLFIFVSLLQLSFSEATIFTVDLIHRDSILSPHYDPSLTRFNILRNAIRRSFTRRSSFGTAVTPDQYGEYLMKIFLGTPKFPIWAIADTGSFLTWAQCAPCSKCYPQNAPLFTPRHSTSYSNISCSSPHCKQAGSSSCGARSTCIYTVSYGDDSYTTGIIGKDTLSFRSRGRGRYISFPNFYFGCGYDNGGGFSPFETGIVGQGNGPGSLISQLNIKRFSYCLPDVSSTAQSVIEFGREPVCFRRNIVSTPLIDNPSSKSPFYYLTLLGFTVGAEKIRNYPPGSRPEPGNIIIDSGTTLTYLRPPLANGITDALRREIKCPRALRAEIENGLALCYNTAARTCRFGVPPVVAHFVGGDLRLPWRNAFVEIENGIQCLTIVNSTDLAVWGNTAQMNFNVVYDLLHHKLSFEPAYCS